MAACTNAADITCMRVQMLPPVGYVGQPASSLATTFVHMSWNKARSAPAKCRECCCMGGVACGAADT